MSAQIIRVLRERASQLDEEVRQSGGVEPEVAPGELPRMPATLSVIAAEFRALADAAEGPATTIREALDRSPL